MYSIALFLWRPTTALFYCVKFTNTFLVSNEGSKVGQWTTLTIYAVSSGVMPSCMSICIVLLLAPKMLSILYTSLTTSKGIHYQITTDVTCTRDKCASTSDRRPTKNHYAKRLLIEQLSFVSFLIILMFSHLVKSKTLSFPEPVLLVSKTIQDAYELKETIATQQLLEPSIKLQYKNGIVVGSPKFLDLPQRQMKDVTHWVSRECSIPS